MDIEQLYEIAGKELRVGAARKGLYAQAFAEALGEESKAKAIYIRLRVEQLQQSLRQQGEQEKNRLREARAQHERNPTQAEPRNDVLQESLPASARKERNGMKAFALWLLGLIVGSPVAFVVGLGFVAAGMTKDDAIGAGLIVGLIGGVWPGIVLGAMKVRDEGTPGQRWFWWGAVLGALSIWGLLSAWIASGIKQRSRNLATPD